MSGTPPTDLDGVKAAHDAAILDFDVGRRVREPTLVVRPRALVARELATHVEGQPARVLHRRSGAAHPGRSSAGAEGSGRRSRRCCGGRRRGVHDGRWAQHRVDDGHPRTVEPPRDVPRALQMPLTRTCKSKSQSSSSSSSLQITLYTVFSFFSPKKIRQHIHRTRSTKMP